jgi:hypothetical protein
VRDIKDIGSSFDTAHKVRECEGLMERGPEQLQKPAVKHLSVGRNAEEGSGDDAVDNKSEKMMHLANVKRFDR